jgi:Zn-dependent peptidase ImmA (M78 family)
MKVNFLQTEEIETATLRLLAEYGSKFGIVQNPPIPVEEMLECHIELSLDFDDLSKKLGIADVLGATWVQEKWVLIDRSLDPTINPDKEGRYRFTVAHEIGHCELHRNLYLNSLRQSTLFQESPEPSIVCRTRKRKDPMEWQADCFAGYLLMPQDMVFNAWEEIYGNMEPYIAVEEITHLSARWGLAEDKQPTVKIARDLARKFLVSGQAMQIRLIGLGLIKTESPPPGLFSPASVSQTKSERLL